jgi:phosphoribosyl 1,2-cyclic phosphodiesterase
VRFSVLASGSSGNAVVVEAGSACVLLDCGLSYRQLRERMEPLGLTPQRIQAVFISHEHDDHVCGLDVFLRRHNVPVLATAGTAAALSSALVAGTLVSGHQVHVGDLTVLPVATSHDAAESVGFVIEHDGCRAGVVTDTGVLTELLIERLSGCHALMLECNHDPELLRYGPYPWPLKQRIASRTGHLSNEQACDGLDRLAHGGLELVVGMHLSRENNRPEMVRRDLARVLAGGRVHIDVADQDRPVAVEVRGPRRREG